MSEIKMMVGLIISSLIALFSPIRDVLLGMVILFAVNSFFGLMADIVSGRGWNWRKALSFGQQCLVYFATLVSIFLIGHLIDQDEEAMTCVKLISIVTTWVFSVNILRNGKSILPADSSMYRVFDIIYYVASVQVVEKLPWVQAYIEARREEREEL